MTIDWSWLETLVVRHAELALDVFARMHREETFYGAIVYAAPRHHAVFDVLLDTVDRAAAAPHERFLPSAFRYHIDIGDTIDQWQEIDDALVEAIESDIDEVRILDGEYATAARFRDIACRVAFALEHGAFTKLSRTPDFAISVTGDPREPGALALARYTVFKKRVARGAPDASS